MMMMIKHHHHIVIIILQRKDFPSNSFYVVVVVKTEDQACGGSLPFYPFVEGTFCVLDLAQGGEGRVTPWEVEEPLWLVGGADEMWGLGPQTLTKLHAATCLTFCFQMNRLIKVTAKKPCQWWYLEQSRVSVGG